MSSVYIFFFFFLELFRGLPWTVTSLFLLKSKSKKRQMKRRSWKSFLSSFYAFLYEMAVMSDQYFNQNEPKSYFKISLYISLNSDVIIWRWCWQQLNGESDRGMNLLLSFTSLSVTSPPRQRCARSFMSFTDVQYVGTQVQVNKTEWMKWTKIVFFMFDCSNSKCPY